MSGKRYTDEFKVEVVRNVSTYSQHIGDVFV